MLENDDFIFIVIKLKKTLKKKATLNMMPIQDGDVPSTFADTQRLQHDLGYHPTTRIEEGVARFVDWYQAYYCTRKEKVVH